MTLPSSFVADHIAQSMTALGTLPVELIEQAAQLIIRTLKQGNKILLCGNGGSAADAQHIAAELMGRYKVNRKALPAIALTTDTSVLTAIANDYGVYDIFRRQVDGLGQFGDCLIAISTSGKSQNILYALDTAKDNGLSLIGLTGSCGFADRAYCDICIKVPYGDTPIIQQCHITIGHAICALVEQEFTK